MFKEMSALAGLMGKLPRIKEEMANFQAKAGEITAEGKAGGDMVVVRVNGKMQVLSLRLDPATAPMHDREMLEDLIKAATNQALEKVRSMLADEARRVAEEIGLPPGLSIPGLS
ncbi:MAG: YbaB/EbfC family nucleoid-associated protein [Gemmataceae bacterium]|nr:YbaB/EbfC family nucleoid-associated protein [Gemmataceae bacterium]